MTSYFREIIDGLWSLFVGLGITFKEFFSPTVTVQYPFQKLEMPARFRGHIQLKSNDEGQPSCIVCMMCQRACPSGCISLSGKKLEGEKKKVLSSYVLDFTRCSLCGSCVESCNFDAIEFSREYTLASGLIACNADRLVRALAGLILCFVGVAGIYYFLNSPFIAMMQMLIYVGAVAVTISFAIMLAAPEQSKKTGPAGFLAGPPGLLTAAILFAGLALLATHTPWVISQKIGAGSVEAIGEHLLTSHALVFELISLILFVAIIGALVIARRGRSN
ncbi:unnamed protein product [Cyprideis torosa]|uniref:NADH-ubiquinone oxidoreductase chain 6 n=1 Tax=Cyprideis torosa TaxID=163714 RepID=A0A7R8ZY34_9CRUS|nr:unnamed protein product [Cyprideis torosa]CAG0907984.1 unnamed protein product [Cyprideis torosa]